MDLPQPSKAHTLPVTSLDIKNALSKSSKELDKEHLLVDQQQQSILIQLPPNIRKIIWKYVLGGMRIGLKEFSISGSLRLPGYTLLYPISKWRTIIQMDDGLYFDFFKPNLRHVTGLLKTCRLMYGSLIIFTLYANERPKSTGSHR